MHEAPSPQDDIPLAAFVGIDWADQKHAGACCAADAQHQIETFQLEQTPEAIDAWACSLRQRFAEGQIAVCLEQSKGALIYALMKYDFFVLYPVNPKQLKRFREAMEPSGAKDDPSDAELVLEMLLKHRGRLHRWQPDDEQTRLIGILVEDRRHLVDQRTRLSNALKSRLKQYFPLALEVLGELHTPLACEFLLRWSTFQELAAEDPNQIASFYRAQHCHRPKLIEERLEKITHARPLITDQAIVESGRLLVRTLTTQLLSLDRSIREYELQLGKLMKRHPDAGIFDAFPGAGDALTPRLLAAFGMDRQRLDHAAQMQQMSGIAPVTIRSGKTVCHVRRQACNKFLHQTFHEFATHSLAQSAWAKGYYDMMRAKGVKHHAAIRALAFKWIRILYRCWKNRTLYNEIHYFQQLRKQGSPILQFISSNP